MTADDGAVAVSKSVAKTTSRPKRPKRIASVAPPKKTVVDCPDCPTRFFFLSTTPTPIECPSCGTVAVP